MSSPPVPARDRALGRIRLHIGNFELDLDDAESPARLLAQLET